MKPIARWAAALWVGLVAQGAAAQAPDLDTALNETVQMVAKKAVIFSIDLETTIYKPDGEGPFPVAVINHGKAQGDPRFQGRYRPAGAARYFLQRGYAVVVPMRQGFSRSGGAYMGVGCNVESNGRVQAEDVVAVLDHVTAQPWADKSRIVVLGQSHGGWTTLAFGTVNYPGVKGLVNFAGGLRQENCIDWKGGLATSVANYAKDTKLPSLWFYGDNDSYFDPATVKPMLERYTASGGNARMVAFGPFGSDAHGMFGATSGRRIWQPEVAAFLASIGMPHEPVPAHAKYAVTSSIPVPPKTGFAPLEDETRVPYLRDSGRAGYKNYLTRLPPRVRRGTQRGLGHGRWRRRPAQAGPGQLRPQRRGRVPPVRRRCRRGVDRGVTDEPLPVALVSCAWHPKRAICWMLSVCEPPEPKAN